MPDELARTDSPLAEPVRRDSSPPERDRGAVQPVPAAHGTLRPSAGTEGDPHSDRSGLGHRDGGQPVPLPVSRRTLLPYAEPTGPVRGGGGPAGTGGFAALRLQRRGPGAAGRRRARPPRVAGLAGRSEPPASPGRGLAALAGDRRRARRAHPHVRARVRPLAPVRRAADARDLVGLPRSPRHAPRLLSLDPPRQRLRAARAPSRPPRAPAHNPNRDPDFSSHRPAARPLLSSASPPRHRARHSRRRHRSPRPPHGRRPLPVPAPSPRTSPRDLSDAQWERSVS